MPRPAYDNELRGVLYENDKQGKLSRPDRTGTCQIKGKEYFMDVWFNENNIWGVRFKPKFSASMPPSRPQSEITGDDGFNDIPF
jgi:hypothetical protein